METANTIVEPTRTIGLDCHPDTFAAAILRGPTPAAAVTERLFHKVGIAQLSQWAQKHSTAEDLFVLEASGNSFQIVRSLAAVGRRAKVLESLHLGQLKETHANNDKISAVRIAKAYLAGTAKEVWVPDTKTQERRDCFHAHRKSVKRTTQLSNRISSYLSDNGFRLAAGTQLSAECWEQIQKSRPWSSRQRHLLQSYFTELSQAQAQRTQWERLIAQEVLEDPVALSLVRLCGIRDLIAFALMALIGDIGRFKTPKHLVKYIGLNPAFDDSGENQWRGGIAGHGRQDLRSLVVQGAQAVLRTNHPVGKWGRRLLARKSSWNLAVAAVARKMVVAVWYLLKGRWTRVEEIDAALNRKIGKIISHLGVEGLASLGRKRRDLKAEVLERLRTGRVYLLKGNIIVRPSS